MTRSENTQLQMNKFVQKFRDTFNDRFGILPEVIVPTKSTGHVKLELYQLQEIGDELINRHRFPDGIRSRTRKREVILVRQALYKVGRDMGYTLDAIGDQFGYNHATVLHGTVTINDLFDTHNHEVLVLLNKIKYGIKNKYGYDGDVQPDNQKGIDA